MTSYPMHLTTEDIANDLNICRNTASDWVCHNKLVGVYSINRYVVSGYHYIQFLMKRPEYKEKSNYYKSFQSYMRRKKYVQKNKKESGDDS